MRRVHEKSIILGIGIGMILTSIAGLVYSGGETGGQTEKLTKEEVIRLAKSYGLVEPVHLIEDESAAAATRSENSIDSNQPVDREAEDSSTGSSQSTAEAGTESRTAADTDTNADTNINSDISTNTDTNASKNTDANTD